MTSSTNELKTLVNIRKSHVVNLRLQLKSGRDRRYVSAGVWGLNGGIWSYILMPSPLTAQKSLGIMCMTLAMAGLRFLMGSEEICSITEDLRFAEQNVKEAEDELYRIQKDM